MLESMLVKEPSMMGKEHLNHVSMMESLMVKEHSMKVAMTAKEPSKMVKERSVSMLESMLVKEPSMMVKVRMMVLVCDDEDHDDHDLVTKQQQSTFHPFCNFQRFH
jgi:hypothetical protein